MGKEPVLEMATVVSTTDLNIPPSLNAALAARKPEVQHVPKEGFRTLRIRTQLLIAYGALAMLTFGVLIGINAVLTTTVSQTVIDTSRSELTAQIVQNSGYAIKETKQVLDARLQEGFSVLVQPTVFPDVTRSSLCTE